MSAASRRNPKPMNTLHDSINSLSFSWEDDHEDGQSLLSHDILIRTEEVEDLLRDVPQVEDAPKLVDGNGLLTNSFEIHAADNLTEDEDYSTLSWFSNAIEEEFHYALFSPPNDNSEENVKSSKMSEPPQPQSELLKEQQELLVSDQFQRTPRKSFAESNTLTLNNIVEEVLSTPVQFSKGPMEGKLQDIDKSIDGSIENRDRVNEVPSNLRSPLRVTLSPAGEIELSPAPNVLHQSNHSGRRDWEAEKPVDVNTKIQSMVGQLSDILNEFRQWSTISPNNVLPQEEPPLQALIEPTEPVNEVVRQSGQSEEGVQGKVYEKVRVDRSSIHNSEETSILEGHSVQLTQQVENSHAECLRQENSSLREELDQLRSQLDTERDNARMIQYENDQLKDAVEQLGMKLKEVNESASSLQEELENRDETVKEKEQEFTKQNHQLRTLSQQVLELRTNYYVLQESVLKEMHQYHGLISNTDRKVGDAFLRVSNLYNTEVKSRKAIFNEMQEMRGNVRVLVRVRPLLALEQQLGRTFVPTFPRENAVTIRESVGNRVRVLDFDFDRVFLPHATQETVLEEVKPLVLSCLDGYNVCIFAYGQTGSGKTFTMEGPNIPDIAGHSQRGLQWRILEELFKFDEQRSETLTSFHASMIEVYCNDVYDLLEEDPKKLRQHKLQVQFQPTGIVMPGLRIRPVTNVEDVIDILQRGRQNRSVAQTKSNYHSSRSHSILSVQLDSLNTVNGEKTSGTLILSDLAGSERLDTGSSSPVRTGETISINTSLTSLGDVMEALAKKNQHIPYRNSKLTSILSSALCRGSKSLMICNVSPCAEHTGETVRSLAFANRIKSIALGPATKRKTMANL